MGQAKRRGTYEERVAQAHQKLDETREKFHSTINEKYKTGLFILYQDKMGGRATYRTVFDRSLIDEVKENLRKHGISSRQQLSSSVHILFQKYDKYFGLDMNSNKVPKKIRDEMNMLTQGVCAYLSTFQSYSWLPDYASGVVISVKEDCPYNKIDPEGGSVCFHDTMPYEAWDTITQDWQARISADPDFIYQDVFNDYIERNTLASQRRSEEA